MAKIANSELQSVFLLPQINEQKKPDIAAPKKAFVKAYSSAV